MVKFSVYLNSCFRNVNSSCAIFLQIYITYLPFSFITDDGSWCGGTQTDAQGWLVAEDKIRDCLWTLIASHDKIIEIEIRTLTNVEETHTCNNGFVEVTICEGTFTRLGEVTL